MTTKRIPLLPLPVLLAVLLAFSALAALSARPALAAQRAPSLEGGFRNPPAADRPWVYWFWLNGNINREGIRLDLEAMKRVGIGGVLIMEVDQGTPVGPVPFASPKWQDLFKYVCTEAQSLGLKVNMNNDAGWAGSGGPWVKPADAMQKVVWTETKVQGPASFDAALPQPKAVAGFYRDIATFAFPSVGSYRLPNIAGLSALVRGDVQPTTSYPTVAAGQTISRASIVNLTSRLGPGGHLAWNVPPGKWTILRMGYTPTGANNEPAPVSGRGLEVDKLSKTALDTYFADFIGKLVKDVGPLAGKTFVATHIDSWETGSQNWTPRFREDFERLRGYDPLPFLPVLTGRVVVSPEVSERFLWDVRQTVGQLLLSNYAGQMEKLAQAHGMHLTIEAYGNTTVSDLAYAGRADEPMGEFWSWPAYGAGSTLTEMSSAAHVYGKPICGAESFTAGDGEKWLYYPGNIKAEGDWAFCRGIQRFVFHRYAFQPWKDRRPGMSMGPWGLHYERTETWWNDSKPWHEYLARCQYLLREGEPVVDILCLAPEGTPRSFTPPASLARTGYKADGCPAEALLTRAKVKDGRIVFPGGMSYRVLLLPGEATMTPAMVRCLTKLADAGAKIIASGPPPTESPSLSDYPDCDTAVRDAAARLWASGHLLRGKTADKVLESEGVPPDFTSNRVLDFIHRRVGDTDIYFVANTHGLAVNALCTFRVSGKVPELWHPETGQIEPAPSYTTSGGLTRVPLRFGPADSVFVVFQPAGGRLVPDPVVSVRYKGAQVWPPVSAEAKIHVLSALWGPAGDAKRTKDVTKQVQQIVDSGETSFVVAELASEGDPAVNIVKTLRVKYEVAGKQFTASATDPQTIAFQLPADAPPPVALERMPDGRLLAYVAKAGTYAVRRASGRTVGFRASGPQTVDVTGSWDLRFPPNWGAPPRVTLAKLVSWSDYPEAGVRYFSGTATYRKTFSLPRAAVGAGRRVTLDLGKVDVIARVKLNGADLGILWRPPYSVDVTGVARAGQNSLEVQVTNLWPNRMIGDAQLPDDSARNPNGTLKAWPKWLEEGKPSPTGRYTFTTWRLWHKNDPLQPSGLLGPVRVVSEATVRVPER